MAEGGQQKQSKKSAKCYACYAEIAEIVCHTPGLYNNQSGNAGPQLLNRIWRCMCEVVETVLLPKHSCIFPNFFHASMKVHNVCMFGGIQKMYKPQLVLLPDFLSKFNLQNVLTMRDAHYHAAVPEILSYVEVSALVGTNKFVVEAALIDSVREIGKYIQRNPSTVLRIDVGVATLEFRDREYRISWSSSFIERLQKDVGPRSLTVPYQPPTMAPGAEKCRFKTKCLTEMSLHDSLDKTLAHEKRLPGVEMGKSI
uniref:CCDC81 HU domain-containing protein n=1 Tax=Trypanosoma vivax (strain Y486) TaxID=1055687 RepID=G0UCX7_TRYVY|nr:conserved hypothetical protein [Trypanosoma vivax Y486]